jgi:hypothetical protein
MSPRPILPFLCAAALTLAAVPGFARVGVFVGFAPPVPVVEAVPAPPAPGYVWQPGYWSWNGAQYVWVPGVYAVALFLTRYGCPEAGPGMAAVGCGPLATGGTGGGEVGRATPRPPRAYHEIAIDRLRSACRATPTFRTIELSWVRRV